jgi:hypothetical protein
MGVSHLLQVATELLQSCDLRQPHNLPAEPLPFAAPILTAPKLASVLGSRSASYRIDFSGKIAVRRISSAHIVEFATFYGISHLPVPSKAVANGQFRPMLRGVRELGHFFSYG